MRLRVAWYLLAGAVVLAMIAIAGRPGSVSGTRPTPPPADVPMVEPQAKDATSPTAAPVVQTGTVASAKTPARPREDAVFGWLVSTSAGDPKTVTLAMGTAVPADEFAPPGSAAEFTHSGETTTLALTPGTDVRLADGSNLSPAGLTRAMEGRAFFARMVDGVVRELVETDAAEVVTQ